MTPEERFERIERDLQAAAETIKAAAESQIETRRAFARMLELQELQQRNLVTLTETTALIGARLTALTEAVTQYVAGSRERMTQMEANLDALIRIITAEHSNGKGKL